MTTFSDLEGLRPSVRPDVVDGLRDTWRILAGPGSAWTGSDRVTLARVARGARRGIEPGSEPSPAAAEAAHRIGADPASVRRPWIEGLEARGLRPAAYVEIVGVVSRVVAVDSILAALGLPPEPLPAPSPEPPTGEIAADARPGRAWVPMVGGRSITQALSLVPAEHAELERFHGFTYLTFEQMGEPAFSRGLDRVQMELVAARTSALNECFY